jgi:hypothetical protein
MTKQTEGAQRRTIKRPETFEYAGQLYANIIGAINVPEATESMGVKLSILFKFMPHDAFDALVESIMRNIPKSAKGLTVIPPDYMMCWIKETDSVAALIHIAATSIAARGDESPWKITVVSNDTEVLESEAQ